MAEYLKKLSDGSEDRYGLAGYLLTNTLSDFGGVTRSVCQTAENGILISTGSTARMALQVSADRM